MIGRRIVGMTVTRGEDGQPNTCLTLSERAEEEIVVVLAGCLVALAVAAACAALALGAVAVAILTEIGGGE